MQNRSGPSTKNRLVYALESQVNESDTSSYEVGEQRERNHRYYTMGPLGNEVPGRSHYISPDVLDTVEGKKALFSESFLSAREVVKFSKSTQPGEAEAKTAYANKCFKKNKIARVLRDAWHDAFVAKRLVCIVEWVDETEEKVMNLPGVLAPQVVQQLQQMPGIVGVDDSQLQSQTMPTIEGPQTVLSGPLTLEVESGFVKISLVQPERYFRDPYATYPDEAQWNTIEEDMARGTLIDLGYDREQVESLAVDYRFRSDEEDAARKSHDSSWTRRRQHNRVKEQETVSYYRTWTWLDVDDEMFNDLNLAFEPEEGLGLYEIHWSHGEVLRWAPEGEEDEDGTGYHAVRQVDEMGIFEWSEMKISHAENGICTADVMAHTQKSQSGLKRLVYDNQQMANAGRSILLSGALKNPRDLIDNKIGATLIAKRLDAVTPLPTPQLSPLTMESIAMFKQDGEERSGISGLAKGMNTDAVKYQNADNMIERLTSAGQRRVTAAARDFANTFMIPVSQHIIKLAMENDTSQDQIECAGQMLPIIPSQWVDDASDMEVDVALTPEEAQRLGQQMMGMHATLINDPTVGPMYGPQQKHAVLDRIYELMGVSDSSKFLLAPSSPEYQQAVQAQQQQAQQAQQMQDQLTGVQVDATVAQTEAIRSGDQREWQKFSWGQTDDMADNLLDERKQDWEEYSGAAELGIKDKQASNNGS